MKKTLLFPALTLLTSAALVAEPETKPAPPSPNVTASGKATITIDVNGQQQTQVIDLGKAGNLKIGDNGGAQLHISAANVSPNTTKIHQTWLGVATDEVSAELHAQLPLAEGTGLLIRSVMGDSPAAQAGLRANDVLVKLDDQLLVNPPQLRALVHAKKEGEAVHLTYLRGGHEATADVKLVTHEESEGSGVLNFVNSITFPSNPSQGQSFVGEIKDMVQPLLTARAIIVDKDGRVMADGGLGDIGEAMKQLEKSLREASVNENVIAQMKKALTDTATTMQKAAGDIDAAKDAIAREVQKAAEEAKKAVDQARRERDEATRVPPAAVPKAP